jgi:hypothetical protein
MKYRATVIVALCSCLPASPPAGWTFAGQLQEYDCNADPATMYMGLTSAYIRSREWVKPNSLGSMMRGFSAAPYAGKRVRLSANLKSEVVKAWCGLWMRVDDANHPQKGYPSSVAYDNMHDGLKDRSIKGATAWKNYSVVLDVPDGATDIYIGVALTGPGEVWINGSRVEIVGPDVPVTGKPLNQPPALGLGPRNLSFEK